MTEAERHRKTRGSVMFLYPVGLLIVVILGAIAVDLGNVWLQQRRLADAADSAANDAVTYGLDEVRMRTSGEAELDPARVVQVVDASIAGHDLPAEATIASITEGVGPSGNPTVTVELSSSASLIFGRLTGDRTLSIAATGTAEVRES